MDDLTKEQAIEILKSKMDGSVDTSYEWVETVRMAIQALEQTRWIPCAERLPEDGWGIYLICTDTGYIATIGYDRSMGWLLNSTIIAWMPLLQPYKGESEESDAENICS